MIGDTIKFTSLYPHKIKITGRTKYFINAFGEEIILDNAEKALQKACEQTGSIVNEYTAGPLFFKDDPRGAHEWLIEFEKEPDSIERFTQILDKSLCEINSDYEAKRQKDITLLSPKITSLSGDTFYKWMQKRGKLGGQNKIPRLANDRKCLDELITFISQ